MAHTTAEWVAAVAKMRKLVGVYLGLKSLNARQQAALQTDLVTLDKDLAGLGASLQASTQAATDAPLSTDPSEAIRQLLARLGFDPNATNSPAAILGAASPEQNRQLTLLGLFGGPGAFAGADYTLFSQYYDTDGAGNSAPKEPYANTGTWQAYMASRV